MYNIPMPCTCRPRLPRFAYRRTKKFTKKEEKNHKICRHADNIGPMPVANAAVARTTHHVSTTWTHGCVNSFLFFVCSNFLCVVLLLFIRFLFVINSFNECFVSYEFSNLYRRGSAHISPYAYIFLCTFIFQFIFELILRASLLAAAVSKKKQGKFEKRLQSWRYGRDAIDKHLLKSSMCVSRRLVRHQKAEATVTATEPTKPTNNNNKK